MGTLKNNFEKGTFDYLVKETEARGLGLNYEFDKFPYVLPQRKYVADFTIVFPSGHRRIIETKGYLRGGDVGKMLAVKKQHPDADIRIFFQRNNKLTKKTYYSDWAEKNGFIYCVGSIPDEWFIE